MGSDVRHFTSNFSLIFKKMLWKNTELLLAKSSNLESKLLDYNKKLNVDVNYWGIETLYFSDLNKKKARALLNLTAKHIILSPRAFTRLYNIHGNNISGAKEGVIPAPHPPASR